jgi:hypothetical protein
MLPLPKLGRERDGTLSRLRPEKWQAVTQLYAHPRELDMDFFLYDIVRIL